MGVLRYFRAEAKKLKPGAQKKMTRVKVPAGSSHWYLITGRQVAIPPDCIIDVDDEELPSALMAGAQKIDP